MVVKAWHIFLKAVHLASLAITASAFIIVVWFAIRIFLFEQFKVPTSSMEPTLYPGDRIIVSKSVIGPRIYTDFHFNGRGGVLRSCRLRGLRRLRHNDIVVFNYPFHDGRISFVINHVYVKRCIALPGDSIGIVNGIYTNNNYGGALGDSAMQHTLARMPEERIDSSVLMKKHYDPHCHWTIKNMPAIYVPRKDDIIRITPREAYIYQRILEWETGKPLTIDWERNKVLVGDKVMFRHRFRHDYYFMAGDNVMDSHDSRYWGVVPEEYVVGVVEFIIH